MNTHIGLSSEQREGVVNILNTLLSDEYILYTKTRNYHWNVTGPQFSELHKFFEEQYAELNTFVDDVAERARALGGASIGNGGGVRPYLATQRVPGTTSGCSGDGGQSAQRP